MCPAGATVGWDVLVKDVSQEIFAVHVRPEDLFWEVFKDLEFGMDSRWDSVFIADTAWVVNKSVSSSNGGGGNKCNSEASHLGFGLRNRFLLL